MITLSTKIEQLKSVGPQYLRRLHSVGIKTVENLLFYFPYRYDDYSQITPIEQLQMGEVATIQGKILEINNIRTPRKRMNLTEAMIQDATGAMRAVWFNQPFLTQTIRKNMTVNLSGKVNFANESMCLSNPTYEIIPSLLTNDHSFTHTGRLVPVYHEAQGLSSRYLRYLIKPYLRLADEIMDFLPTEIINELNLIDLNTAIRQIHFPDNLPQAQSAKRRLAFNEFFLIQLMLLKQKQKISRQPAVSIPFNQKLIKKFVTQLPFELTNDQRVAAWEIFQDLEKSAPMNRLLNGDVGSGKTIVAIAAALEVAKSGCQTALMAPTEILAKQHFDIFAKFLSQHRVNIGLLTGNENLLNNNKIARTQLKEKITKGKIDIVIGTHALITSSQKEKIYFKNLALAVIDEQHRFGVAQRAAMQKNINQIDGLPTTPHFLSMTATPIPRTLTLTLYGDLDISLLKEMPQGRQKIITKIVAPANRPKAYNFIKNQIKRGKQVFVVCPLIEESENLATAELKSVTQEYEKLSTKIFPEFTIAMLHGRLKTKEKEDIMRQFKNNKINIMVSTSVIEVGIDIPNATVIMIEGTDRFGLAQLHQFRGRIGRGQDQSYCFLFTESNAKKTRQRLKALLECQNGFELAEKDLQIRGPGDFTGARQWGLPDLTMASLNDVALIKQARQAAARVLSDNLSSPALKEKLKSFQNIVHLE